jgi:hypothetical protein
MDQVVGQALATYQRLETRQTRSAQPASGARVEAIASEAAE